MRLICGERYVVGYRVIARAWQGRLRWPTQIIDNIVFASRDDAEQWVVGFCLEQERREGPPVLVLIQPFQGMVSDVRIDKPLGGSACVDPV
jgi:hypothetical protein